MITKKQLDGTTKRSNESILVSKNKNEGILGFYTQTVKGKRRGSN